MGLLIWDAGCGLLILVVSLLVCWYFICLPEFVVMLLIVLLLGF